MNTLVKDKDILVTVVPMSERKNLLCLLLLLYPYCCFGRLVVAWLVKTDKAKKSESPEILSHIRIGWSSEK